MDSKLKEPWKLDTNGKYVDVVKTILGLSTASLLLPVFMARNFLVIDASKPLTEVFTCSIYWAWFLFGISILAGVFFQYLSAKWVRTAWGKEAGIFWSKSTKESTIERCMEFSLWLCVLMFILGLVLTLVYFISYENGL
jgi:uncharacterized membrane protein